MKRARSHRVGCGGGRAGRRREGGLCSHGVSFAAVKPVKSGNLPLHLLHLLPQGSELDVHTGSVGAYEEYLYVWPGGTSTGFVC